MCWPRRTLATQYGNHGQINRFIVERKLIREYLYWSRIIMSKEYTSWILRKYLNHQHGERVNIRFFAGILFAQDFGCRPSWGVYVLMCSRPYGIQVFGHSGNTEVRNKCARGVLDHFHQYIDLVGRQRGSETRFWIPRTPLRSP